MVQFLEAVIEGEDSGLEDALDDVAQSAGEAASALERAEDAISNIRDDAAATAQSLESVSDELEKAGAASAGAAKGLEKTGDELSGATIRAESLNISVDSLSEAQMELAGASYTAADALDQEEEQAGEAASSLGKLSGAIFGESAAAQTGAAANQNLSSELDDVQDEANDATAAMAGTASMAELLSLQSSALSINVGAFTIALRNLTTQVPLLVASLGNLATVLMGVATGIGAVAAGGLGVVLGGALAEAEGLAGSLENTEHSMEAIAAIGETFRDMLIEAIQPLMEVEGAVATFRSFLEEIATTVKVFSESIADSFEGPLGEAINTISDAWMSSIVEIGEAFEYMVAQFEGAGIFDVFAEGITMLDDFIRFVTDITVQFADLMSTASGHIGPFIRELMALGLSIGEGLMPVLNAFFGIMSEVARVINEVGSETISTVVELAALALAINRIAGIMGSMLQPMALVIGHISSIALEASSMSEAFLRATGNMLSGITNLSSGFGALVGSFQTMIPFVERGETDILNYAQAMEKGDGIGQRLAATLRSLSMTNPFTGLRSSASNFASMLTSTLLPSVFAANQAMGQTGEFGFAANQLSTIESLSMEITAFKRRSIRNFKEMASASAAAISGTLRQALVGLGASLLMAAKHTTLLHRHFLTMVGAMGGGISTIGGALVGALSSFRMSLLQIPSALQNVHRAWISFTAVTSGGVPMDMSEMRAANMRMTDMVTGWRGLWVQSKNAISGAMSDINSAITRGITAAGRSIQSIRRSWISFTAVTQAGVPMDMSEMRAANMRMSDMVTGWRGLWSQLKSAILRQAVSIQNFISDIPDKMSAARSRMRTIGLGMAVDLQNGLMDARSRMGEVASSMMNSLDNFLWGNAADVIQSTDEIGGMMRGNIGDFSDADIQYGVFRRLGVGFERVRQKAISAVSGVVQFGQGIVGSLRSVDSFSDAMSAVDDALPSITGKMMTLIPTTSILGDRFEGLSRDMFSISSIASTVNGAFETLRAKMMSTSFAAVLARLNFTSLFTTMATSGIPALSGLGRAMSVMTNVMRGNLALTKGLKTAYATLVGATSSASAGQLVYATATTIASAATSLLSGGVSVLVSLLGSLAVVTGAVVAALGAFVAIAGSVAAVLMSIGEGGASADDIIGGLIETAKELGQAVMPLIVSSGNMMIDIFNSIMAPINQLMGGFNDIAVALGFIEEGAAKSTTAIGAIGAASEWLAGIVQMVGDVFREYFGAVAGQIRMVMDQLQSFLVDINFGDKVRAWVDTLRSLGQQMMNQIGPIMSFVSVIEQEVIGVIDNLINATMDVVGAFAGAFGMGGDGLFSGYLSTMEGIYSFLIDLIAPTLDLIGSLFSALAGIVNVAIGALAAGLEAVAGLIGFVVDGVDAFIEGLTGMSGGEALGVLIGGFQKLMSSLGPTISFLADIVDVLAVVGGIGATALGEVWGMLMNIFSFVGDLLLPIIEAIGMTFRLIFDTIIGIVTGTIDTIMRYFDTLGEMVNDVISGDFIGAFNHLKNFVMNTFSGLISFFAGIFSTIGNIVMTALGGVINTIIDAFLSIPDVLVSAFESIGAALANAIAGPWNDYIAGDLFTISVPDWVPDIGGNSWSLSIPEIGGGSIPSPGDAGGGGGGAESVEIQDSTLGSEDLMEGVSTAGNVAEQGKEAAMGGAPGRVEYNEGETQNNFNQNISADPEDKAQISRIAKDAMEEANSFARRQQGGQ